AARRHFVRPRYKAARARTQHSVHEFRITLAPPAAMSVPACLRSPFVFTPTPLARAREVYSPELVHAYRTRCVGFHWDIRTFAARWSRAGARKLRNVTVCAQLGPRCEFFDVAPIAGWQRKLVRDVARRFTVQCEALELV